MPGMLVGTTLIPRGARSADWGGVMPAQAVIRGVHSACGMRSYSNATRRALTSALKRAAKEGGPTLRAAGGKAGRARLKAGQVALASSWRLRWWHGDRPGNGRLHRKLTCKQDGGDDGRVAAPHVLVQHLLHREAHERGGGGPKGMTCTVKKADRQKAGIVSTCFPHHAPPAGR